MLTHAMNDEGVGSQSTKRSFSTYFVFFRILKKLNQRYFKRIPENQTLKKPVENCNKKYVRNDLIYVNGD